MRENSTGGLEEDAQVVRILIVGIQTLHAQITSSQLRDSVALCRGEPHSTKICPGQKVQALYFQVAGGSELPHRIMAHIYCEIVN